MKSKITCRHCGKEFFRRARNQLYCCSKCQIKAKNERAETWEAENKQLRLIRNEMKKITKLTDKKLEQIHKEGKTYAEYQIEQTLAMVEKVRV